MAGESSETFLKLRFSAHMRGCPVRLLEELAELLKLSRKINRWMASRLNKHLSHRHCKRWISNINNSLQQDYQGMMLTLLALPIIYLLQGLLIQIPFQRKPSLSKFHTPQLFIPHSHSKGAQLPQALFFLCSSLLKHSFQLFASMKFSNKIKSSREYKTCQSINPIRHK